MLTEKTQKILCDLLMNLSKQENSIQITRGILSNSLNFSPNHIFSYLTSSNKLTYIDIYNYLISKGVSINEIEAKLIILFYDKDMDNELSYYEFIPLLSDKKCINNNFLVSNICAINDNVEYLLIKIFNKEIELCRNFLGNLKKLKTRNDFDIHQVFHHLTNKNFINKFFLSTFLEYNNIDFLDLDINNIIKRLDINKDGIIDINEFIYLFDFPKSLNYNYRNMSCHICRGLSFKKSTIDTNPNMNLLEKMHNNRYGQNLEMKSTSNNFPNHKFLYINETSNNKDSTNSSNRIRIKKYNSQPKLYNSDINNLHDNFSISRNGKYNSDIINNIKRMIYLLKNKKSNEKNIRCDIFPQNHFNPNLKTSRIAEINKYLNSNKNNFDIFNNLLKLIMQSEMEIEKEKINFVKNVDISFYSIYLIFDKDRKGYITEDDLKNAFFELKIIEDDNYDIFLNRFDKNKNKIIEESDFFDIIVPFNKTFRKFMENKIRINNWEIIEDLNIIYNIKNLFNFIINKEKEINNYKINFIEKNSNLIILNDIFDLIDKNKKGYFSYDELNLYCRNYNLMDDDYTIALLFIRLDKQRKGKIELEDFIDGL